MILDDYLMNDEVTEDDILDLVDSKIPNIYFVAPVLELKNDEFQDRKYYDLFSKVLILRGEDRIKDVYGLLFFWLKDFNLPGSLQIREFLIRSERSKFMAGIYQSIILAHDDDDEEWLSNLLSTLSERDSGPIGDLCEYMIDMDDYINDYQHLLELIEKDQDIKEYEE
ncbi:MAG: hypothetical protein ACI35W_04545 [Anaeroplasmataceae bacterium]